MTEQTDGNRDEVAILDIANDTKTRVDFINRERHQVIQTLARRSGEIGRVPDISDHSNNPHLFDRLRMLLRWLDEDVRMTVELKEKTKIGQVLELMFNTPRYHFPEADANEAKQLFEKWESENWGANEVIEEENGNENNDDVDESEASEEPQPKRRRKSTSSKPKGEMEIPVAKLLLPPRNHPIFGEGGIAHGVAIKKGKKRDYVLDRRFIQREAKVYGHNGLSVGTWFPVRMVALFRGAHGSTQGGISGNTQTGAYSIVVAGSYEELDQDQGEILWYSGSNSHNNEDPQRPAESSTGTLALQASYASEKPVRVLRSATGNKTWAPVCGLRYDGLYTVASTDLPLNTKGGRYEQFKLVRLEGQPPMEDLRSRPTQDERRDYAKLKDGY